MKWLALASLLVATSAAAERVEWTRRIGDYRAVSSWKNCVTPGTRKPRIAIDAVDGRLVVDLTKARGGLKVVDLVEHDDGSLTGADLDARVEIDRNRLTVTYDSGCVMSADLYRDPRSGAGIWGRIARKCSRTHIRDGVVQAVIRKGHAARVHADRIRRAVIDAGCYPVADPAGLVPGQKCMTLSALASRLKRCDTAPPALEARAEMALTLPTTADDPATRVRVEEVCGFEADRLRGLAHGTGCQ